MFKISRNNPSLLQLPTPSNSNGRHKMAVNPNLAKSVTFITDTISQSMSCQAHVTLWYSHLHHLTNHMASFRAIAECHWTSSLSFKSIDVLQDQVEVKILPCKLVDCGTKLSLFLIIIIMDH